MKKLKIAHFGHKNCMTTEGGVEVVVAELATRQAASGHDVTCYNRSGHHISGAEFDVPKVKMWKGVHMKYVPTIQMKGLAAVTSAFFSTLCCTFGGYDVVHVHAEGPACFTGILAFSKKFNKNLRICFTCHGLDWARDKWRGGIGSKLIKFGEKMAVKYADEVIVLSRNAQKYFKETYGRNTVFIQNGVNRPRVEEPDIITEKWNLYKNSYFLYLSRVTPEKGAHYLIEAFKAVNTDKKLVIAGGKSDTAEYEEKIHRLAEDDSRILFTGFVQGQVLAELYSNAYVYVLPSDLEGMPLSLLEAMSYGNCCLVSDIPECLDVVEGNAESFGKGNIRELTEKLQQLCAREELVRQYKSTAAGYICEKYNWEDIIEKMNRTYMGMVG